MKILGIETSCDDTGVALFDSEQGLIAHQLYSQTDIHQEYGGIVPELASRDHIRKLLPLIKQMLNSSSLNLSHIDAVAYTAGPGLMGSLFVGACAGKSLAYALNIPSVAVHHMEGHLLAPMLETPKPEFPFVALLVSGGHTQLYEVSGIGQYQLLGDTLDDAAGEAFDKTARLLGLGYPGGPALAKLALQGNAARFQFPRPMTQKPGLDFSFSGLKTYALTTLQKAGNDAQTKADIACAFEQAVVDTLTIKCQRALKHTNLNKLVISGGVSANKRLREKLDNLKDTDVYYPRLEFCTDNGAMIAYAGYQHLKQNPNQNLKIKVKPRWPLNQNRG